MLVLISKLHFQFHAPAHGDPGAHAMGVPSRHGDPREDNGEALPHPRQEPTPAPRRPAPAVLPVPSQPQWGSPEHNWDRPPSIALQKKQRILGKEGTKKAMTSPPSNALVHASCHREALKTPKLTRRMQLQPWTMSCYQKARFMSTSPTDPDLFLSFFTEIPTITKLIFATLQ